jgi:hypothetical protein
VSEAGAVQPPSNTGDDRDRDERDVARELNPPRIVIDGGRWTSSGMTASDMSIHI